MARGSSLPNTASSTHAGSSPHSRKCFVTISASCATPGSMVGCPHFSRGQRMVAPSNSPNDPAEFKPYVPASQSPPEFTVKAVVLGAIFGIIFGAATVYLALKAGLTVSASIPIAVLSIAVFKRIGKSTILENNIVQTIGSAGESIAAGVVFTIPALIFLYQGEQFFRYGQIL